MYFMNEARLPSGTAAPAAGDVPTYETKLNATEEMQFRNWKQRNAPRDSGADYDLRGAFKAGLQPAANGHWPDTYKKPNHPTFSDQSIYAKDRPELAGSWNGEQYIPPTRPRANVLPPPDNRSIFEIREADRKNYWTYVKAADDLQHYRDNINSSVEARQVAYERRIAAIKDATGVTVENPYATPDIESKDQSRAEFMGARKKKFVSTLQELAQKFPDKRDVIRPDVPIEDDAFAVTREKVAAMGEAEQETAGLFPGARFLAGLHGSMKGMLRDPAQVLSLFAGAPEISAFKSVGGRILARVFTEAAVNGAVELPVQLAAENWRKQAGVPLGWSGMWQQVGLAAAFGGGFGGLLQGGSEIMRSLKKATPETDAAIGRLRDGSATASDVKLIAEAAGVALDEPEVHALSRAIDEDADDALVTADGADGREVAQVVHAIENDLPVPRPQSGLLPPGNFEFFNPDDLAVDAKRFQFKEGGDAEGVTDTLRGVTKWVPENAGDIIVFEDLQGRRFVADGHQRFGLARRLKAQGDESVRLKGFVYREADGFSDGDVRIIAALKNIGEKSGTALDGAKILRSGIDISSTGLPPKSALVRDAAGLARLSDDAFAMAVNEVIDPQLAAVVGRLAEDKALHAQMISVLKEADAKTIGEAESMVRDMLNEPTFTEHQENLFGEAEVARMLLKEKAQVRGATLRALRKDRAVFNSLIEEQKRIAETGNVLDTAANTERAKTDATLIEAIDRLSRQVGPVATALNDAATAVAGGAGAPTASRGFIDAVRDEIRLAGGNLARIGDAEPAHVLDPAIAGSKLTEPATKEGAEAAAQALDAATPEGLRSTDAAKITIEPIPFADETKPFIHIKRDGEDIGALGLEILPDGTAIIKDIDTLTGPNSLGPKALMGIRDQILALFPNVKRVQGIRATGARDASGKADRNVTVELAPDEQTGLFDDQARAQLDIMDALPAGTDAAGKPLLTTHAELTSQADRVDHLADVISSCKG